MLVRFRSLEWLPGLEQKNYPRFDIIEFMNEVNKKIILVIEDESAYQRALREKLEMSGFTVLLAKNGEEGLTQALQNHPDLILLDLKMPVMDGMETVNKLRQDSWGKNAKVIILTNFASIDFESKSIENERFEFIIKSDSKIEHVIAKVNELVGQ